MSKKAETCECCGRNLPESEICGFCGHDNHRVQVSGWAVQRIHKEIEKERALREGKEKK